ncbi:MAG TPA: hypothetical protein VK971_13555 [Thiohalobacter sp.]|nr:hypothetical protein [Thiohalobacter sp.]
MRASACLLPLLAALPGPTPAGALPTFEAPPQRVITPITQVRGPTRFLLCPWPGRATTPDWRVSRSRTPAPAAGRPRITVGPSLQVDRALLLPSTAASETAP